MPGLQDRTAAAAGELMGLSEDQLYEQLGRRVKGVGIDPDKAGDPSAIFPADAPEMGLVDDLGDFGKRVFDGVVAQAHDFVCGDNPDAKKERQDLIDAFGVSQTQIAGVLAAGLVTTVGIAPAAAAVVGAIVVKRVVPATYNALCEWWSDQAK